MVDESPVPRAHTGLPLAPRLQRSTRLRRALNLQRLSNPPTSPTERPRPLKARGNFFAFISAQVLIAVVAFVLVSDYMADGYIKNTVLDIFYRGAGDGNDSKIDQEVTIVVKPPAALDEVPNQEISVQKFPAPIEPVETPPAGTQKPVVSAESTPQAEEQVTAPVVEPEPVPQAAAPIATPAIEPEPVPQAAAPIATPAIVPEPVPQAAAPIATPAIEPEPVPQAVPKVTVPIVEPETAPKAEEQVVVVAPIPDLTPLKDAPVAPLPLEPAKPTQADGQIFRDCTTCPELVLISPGRFVMGAGNEGLVSVTTAQEVAIAAPFAIGRYEITFDEWSQCVTDGGCTSQPADENWGRGRRPVINVSFNNITQQYLPWLSGKTGFTYRLPTEAEWEFAARGGAAAPAGLAYSFGDDTGLLCEYGNSSDLACNDGYATTAPAGSLKPNALGLFDMHGNVWEWMADCWQPQYSAKLAKSTEACTTRVLRGGSWASAAPALRSAARGWEQQDKSKNSIGFRVARSQP
jgi:formylglycine-generating enzyme required for sulfatase activity